MSTGRWRQRPGLGCSVKEHPLHDEIRRMVSLDVRPRWILLGLKLRYREGFADGLEPLPSERTLRRYIAGLPAYALTDEALARRQMRRSTRLLKEMTAEQLSRLTVSQVCELTHGDTVGGEVDSVR